jgi:hypothetical protein
MRNEVFNQMNYNKQKFIHEVKSGKNPNPFKNRVEEEQKKMLSPAETAAKPLLQIERIHDKKKYTVMENLGAVRKVKISEFIQRSRENLLKKLYEWFEVPPWVADV